MPLWHIYHSPGIFDTPEIRKSLAADITKLYTTIVGLPAFYVVVRFICLPHDTAFIGGEITNEKPFVSLVVEHVAVHKDDGGENAAQIFSDRINEALAPYMAEKGYDWEITISDTARDYWRINGMVPPAWKSEAEKRWVELNRPVEWQGK
ncbi:unnamed protein product [Clonostachys byssicola]|uniref:Tautomerase cis-CaaD-like domain-containing protein n=1 Tax=Clonostachys byssicola TaxID=160290 RepID=A0A9N9URI9_9HYPO|nr:unnamed protein product [Clonostachys byssicola]